MAENNKKLLAIRKNVKTRKPTFRRKQENQYAKFKNDSKWRKPKGRQNKVRLQRKGNIGMLKVGYKSPKAVRGLNGDGLREVRVENLKDLLKVDIKNNEVGVLSRTLGKKKKLEILKEALNKKISFSNAKDIKKEIEKIENFMKDKKDKKKIKQEKVSKKVDSAKKTKDEVSKK